MYIRRAERESVWKWICNHLKVLEKYSVALNDFELYIRPLNCAFSTLSDSNIWEKQSVDSPMTVKDRCNNVSM